MYLGLLLWECFHEPCDYLSSKATGNSTLRRDVLDKSLFGMGIFGVALAQSMESKYRKRALWEHEEIPTPSRTPRVARGRLVATTAALALLFLPFGWKLRLPMKQTSSDHLGGIPNADTMASITTCGLQLLVLVTMDGFLAFWERKIPPDRLERHQRFTPLFFAALISMMSLLLNLGIPDATASACCFDRHLYWITVPGATVLCWLVHHVQDTATDHIKLLSTSQWEHPQDGAPLRCTSGGKYLGTGPTGVCTACSINHDPRSSPEDLLALANRTEREQHPDARSLRKYGRELWKHTQQDPEARKILSILAMNLAYAGIEFFFGLWSHSLGLVSDAAHMLLDASALFMGLLASYWTTLPPNGRFTFGFQRVEVLAGFTNALLLSLVALSIWVEASSRLLHPVVIETQAVLPISCIGLLVNLLGLWLLRHRHQHLGEPSCSHEHNMGAIYLHVFADALGSVGVIISSLLIRFRGWQWSDPLCSMLIASLILLTTVPFLKRCYRLLAGVHTERQAAHLQEALQKSELGSDSYQIQSLRVWYLTWDIPVITASVRMAGPPYNLQLLREAFRRLIKGLAGHQAQVFVETDLLERVQPVVSRL
jgi:zinc transporter 5/7